MKDISRYTEKYRFDQRIDTLYLKSGSEIDCIRESAGIVRDLLTQLHKLIKPGVNELDIAAFCENYIIIRDAEPFLKTANLYPYAVLISRNNVAFHGIPENICLESGDIITVDVVLQKNGWFGDGAWTYTVGQCSDSAKALVSFSNEIIFKCISAMEQTGDLLSIVDVIDRNCKKSGFRVLDEGAGHGIGAALHEAPQILFGPDAESIPLRKGMVFTIEPVFTDCREKMLYSDNGTAYVKEGFIASQFEHMVAVNDNEIEILTDRNQFFLNNPY